jgi:hypothetical protein
MSKIIGCMDCCRQHPNGDIPCDNCPATHPGSADGGADTEPHSPTTISSVGVASTSGNGEYRSGHVLANRKTVSVIRQCRNWSGSSESRSITRGSRGSDRSARPLSSTSRQAENRAGKSHARAAKEVRFRIRGHPTTDTSTQGVPPQTARTGWSRSDERAGQCCLKLNRDGLGEFCFRWTARR